MKRPSFGVGGVEADGSPLSEKRTPRSAKRGSLSRRTSQV